MNIKAEELYIASRGSPEDWDGLKVLLSKNDYNAIAEIIKIVWLSTPQNTELCHVLKEFVVTFNEIK